MPKPGGSDPLYRIALAALTRRDYGVAELRTRLRRAGEPDDVEAVLAVLAREGLLSDARYAAARAETGRRKGWGPLRLRHDLERHGVAPETIRSAVEDGSRRWSEEAEEVRRRRFGEALPGDRHEAARQARFLKGRGFTAEQIRRVLRPARNDDFEQG
ncbi:MAG: regulatory protein RecX [Acidiferrobacteraceae bacterium]